MNTEISSATFSGPATLVQRVFEDPVERDSVLSAQGQCERCADCTCTPDSNFSSNQGHNAMMTNATYQLTEVSAFEAGSGRAWWLT